MQNEEDILKLILDRLNKLEAQISELQHQPPLPKGQPKKLSIKEFILKKKPVDDVQKTLVIGYYLEHYEAMESFNIKDLNEGYRTAREPVPKNINDKVNLNISKGHLMAAKEKKDNFKAWYLTNSGEKHVEDIMGTNGD